MYKHSPILKSNFPSADYCNECANMLMRKNQLQGRRPFNFLQHMLKLSFLNDIFYVNDIFSALKREERDIFLYHAQTIALGYHCSDCSLKESNSKALARNLNLEFQISLTWKHSFLFILTKKKESRGCHFFFIAGNQRKRRSFLKCLAVQPPLALASAALRYWTWKLNECFSQSRLQHLPIQARKLANHCIQ